MNKDAVNSLLITFLFGCFLLALPVHIVAADAAKWQSGRIIDDGTFTNSADMSASQIQDFLNQKVGTGGSGNVAGQCDVSGSGVSELGGGTRAQYGSAHNNPSPFTCLKDYYEVPKTIPGQDVPANNYGGRPTPPGAQSAAQIIWSAAQAYNISSRVLLVMIEKESVGPLLTDSWPFQSQYRYAMGTHCFDELNGPQCDSNYSGFSIQIYESARLLRYYLDNMQQPWWSYAKPYQNNQILWNTTFSDYTDGSGNNVPCGSGNVFVNSKATAALFTYTPYQPNQAALNNLYTSVPSGTGFDKKCAAYGNRNFWRIFTDWFGPTTIDAYPVSVETAINGDGKYYLVVGNTKRWIPSGSIYNDWNLGNYPLQTVSNTTLNQIPSIPNLGNLGVTAEGNYVLVSNGKKWYLNNSDLVNNWGYANTLPLAAPMYGTLAAMTSMGAAASFVKDSNGLTYIMSAGTLQPIGIDSINAWNASNLIPMSLEDIAAYPLGVVVNTGINIDGQKYVVDGGKLIKILPILASSYSTIAPAYTELNSTVLRLFSVENSSPIIQSSASGNWYLLINGSIHYILNSDILSAWGYSVKNSEVLSTALFDQFKLGPPLSVTVHTTSGKDYFLDGTKHAIEAPYSSAWIGDIPSMQLVDGDLTTPTGAPLTTPLVQIEGTPHIYTLINGRLLHISNGNILNGYGNPAKYQIAILRECGLRSLPFGGEASQFVINSTNTYYLQDGIAYSLALKSISDWTLNTQPYTYGGLDFSARFNPQETELGSLLKRQNNSIWIVSSGGQVNVSTFSDAYTIGSLSLFYAKNLAEQNQSQSYLVRSDNISDSRIWLINAGSKYWIPDQLRFAAYSAGTVPVMSLSDNLINIIPNAIGVGELPTIVASQNTGLKYLDNGGYFAFPDSRTVQDFVGSRPILMLSHSIYNALNLQVGNISIVLKDKQTQKVYVMKSGLRSWITNAQAYEEFASIAITVLAHSSIMLIPEGIPTN